ncbi:MAG: hypothetical protein D6735_00965 [Acidobacteria bacterium]|nr:MAG: hypothetical protein D6735_00965 [Acidobacteriota bacterium]
MKHQRKVKDEQGHSLAQTEYFYGYKAHISMNGESELMSSLEVSADGAYDDHYFTGLVEQDLGQGLPVETYVADKGYDDSNNHFYCTAYTRQFA